MNNTYLLLKTIHVLGVVLFLGNIIVTGWWKNMADRTRNPQIIAFAQRQVILTDYIFTGGGIVILTLAAYSNIHIHQIELSLKWLMHGQALFLLSGLIWLIVLIPVQIRQSEIVREFATGNMIPEEYWKLCSRWNIWGALATLLPLTNLYWMVFKPA
ncbi:MAG TPA: DUF2269 family protein [Methylophilus sp.]|nr:DUF2269 family protein [Methylophilus sp.]HQQ33002.1 DUF2269 family protein [Methylophilus sp.]